MNVEAPPCRCEGIGTLTYRHVERDGDGQETMTSTGSVLCPCRRDLPPRAGEVRWWSTEVVWRRDWRSITDLYGCTIEVSVEIPVSADNYRLHRHGNRYWPTGVSVIWDRSEMPLLMDEDVRSLALLLGAAATVATSIDEADLEPCGEWASCSCHSVASSQEPPR